MYSGASRPGPGPDDEIPENHSHILVKCTADAWGEEQAQQGRVVSRVVESAGQKVSSGLVDLRNDGNDMMT